MIKEAEYMGLTREQGYFIEILRDHIEEKQSRIADIDWSKMYILAQSQQMSAIVSFQCKSMPSVASFHNSYYATLSQYARRNKYIENIKEAFAERNINYFIVKGCKLAKYYPQPALRTMGDLDVVTDDRETSKEELERIGFRAEIREKCDDWKFFKNDFEIELHDRLLYDSVLNNEKLKIFFNNAWIYVKENELDFNLHFLYLFVHARKHLMDYGIGFRQFFDIAAMIKNESRLDWSYIEEKFIELDLIAFASKVFALIERWFSVVAPIEYDAITDDAYREITASIFNGGIFGHDDENTVKNVAANVISNSKHPHWLSFKRVISRVFPNYKTMVYYGGFHILEGKPVLLPVAWMLRIFNGITGSRLKRGINETFVSSSYIKKRKEYLAMWGL